MQVCADSHLSLLKKHFGHTGFREGQEELIQHILSGRDVLGIMPTGAGKSVCYQIPALLMPGVTLVVSPLISLMKDQVGGLVQAGVKAAYLNSSLTAGQYREALRRAALGAYRIIYVAPERLLTAAFLNLVEHLEISMVTVDEAHCVSQWGQDFRPSYLQIPEFVRALPRRPVVSAFTATATAEVKEDICQMLLLEQPYTTVTGFDRRNLFFSVQKTKDKSAAVLEYLRYNREKSGIIYCSTRKAVEQVCAELQDNGYAATRYHAGLTEVERRRNQDDFLYDRKRLMVATNAFGMGIDKSNVSFVIHYNLPKNLESYYQEAGRAGRDGAPADCLLLFGGRDLQTNRFLIDTSLDENQALSPAQREVIRAREYERLQKMRRYAEHKGCLRAYILKYFGEQSAAYCGNCGNCLQKVTPAQGIPYPTRMVHPALFEQLKMLRSRLAMENGVPAYIIFSDATLRDMCRRCPVTEEEFLMVSGVGEVKANRYGADFRAAILEFLCAENKMATGSKGKKNNEQPPAPQYAQAMPQDSNRPWSEGEEAQLREEYTGGLPHAEICRRHGRSRGAITTRLRKLGLLAEEEG